MTEEITIDGMPFIAARSAAAMVGMSPDYLTRWCREGLVTARRLAGGIWFVNLQSLYQHLAEREARKMQWRAQLSQRLKQERALATS
jgi:predicted site-specific integrase-resolvase